MISAIRGEALQQRASFLLDRKDERIVSPLLTIADMPLMEGHPGARCFDDEGVASKNMSVIEKGVLKNYFISRYIGRKTGMEATTGSPSVLIPEIGDKSLAEMISECEKGIFITDFNGGNCNDTTGDFSYGAEGFLIENGILTTPFSEMIITGDMLTLWNNLSAVGNDPRMESSRSLPSMRFEDVSVS
jgi:PmbA protein